MSYRLVAPVAKAPRRPDARKGGMMKDPRIEKLAEMLVNYSVAIQPGETVAIRGSTLAEPLLLEVYKQVLLAGGLPVMYPAFSAVEEILYRYGSEEQLRFIPAPLKQIIETVDAQIQVMGEANTRALTGVDPARTVTRGQAFQPILKTFLERSASKSLKWTLTLFPTQAHAQDAEMSLSEYEDFVYSACMPNLDDPVGYWRKFSARQEKIVAWLKDKQRVRVIAPETELTMSIAGRPFINCDCHENVPDGEVFTGPVENSMNGHVRFSYPAIVDGREVSGVRLWFENGKCVKATADKNEDYLNQTLDTDEGARYVGEFAIGTNEGIQRFTREILFDEKIGGSFHMALGAGYPETGSSNESAVHWDMICDMRQGGEIWADEQLLYKDGKFAIDL
jgi:aminopeptidase